MKQPGARCASGSFVDPEAQAPCMTRLKVRLERVAGAGVIDGIRPPDRHVHALTESRCADRVIRAALRAEREGYDAFVIGHFQEPGLTECRGAVDIPLGSAGAAYR